MRPVEQDFGLRDQRRVSVIRRLRRRLVDRPAEGSRIRGRERGAGRRGQAPKHGDGEGSYHALTTQNDLPRSRAEGLRAYPRRRAARCPSENLPGSFFARGRHEAVPRVRSAQSLQALFT
jgi:hypothetical protein